VQEVVREKNSRLLEDCAALVSRLSEKLEYEGGTGHFINATYEEAVVYTRYAETLLNGIDTQVTASVSSVNE
jgi:hypothetical protein